jgi:hypothetical protein
MSASVDPTVPQATYIPCPEQQCRKYGKGHGHYDYLNGNSSDEFCSQATALRILVKDFGPDANSVCDSVWEQLRRGSLALNDQLVDPVKLKRINEWNELNWLAQISPDEAPFEDGKLLGLTAHGYISGEAEIHEPVEIGDDTVPRERTCTPEVNCVEECFFEENPRIPYY